jgi:hypothetical protein
MLVQTDRCETCGRARGQRHKATTPAPSLARLERMMDAQTVPATDGCRVEPDGICQHGHKSWLLRLGFV